MERWSSAPASRFLVGTPPRNDVAHQPASRRFRFILPACLCVSLVLSAAAFAQPTTAPADDTALLNELAARDLNGLLERAFATHHTPPEQQRAIRATAALAKLARDGATLPTAQRRAIVNEVVAGIAPVIPSLGDPRKIAQQADALLRAGAAAEVNVLEYWGPSTVAQAQLRPVAQTAIALLDRTIALSDQQAAALTENANPNDPAALRRIEAMESVGQFAQQSKAMAQYDLALACDAADPARKQAADAAIGFLESLDADGNPARDAVRIALGKLYALEGNFAKARTALDAAVASTATTPATASADVLAQLRARAFESRYFRAVVEIQAGDAKAARDQLGKLQAWEQSNPSPADASIATADRLLEYRVLAIEPGDDVKGKASALLMQLLAERPDLEGPIMTQLRANVAPDAPVASLEPLLLRSLVTDAQDRVVRAQADPSLKPDPAVLNRGLSAANELIRRQGHGVDDRNAAEAAFLVPVFLEALDRKAEAAKGYVDFAETHKQMPELAKAALENGQRVFAQLGGLHSDDPNVTSLYDRILPLAISAPFDQTELTFDWAVRLQQTDHPDQAVAWFDKVDVRDARYPTARFLMMVALAQQFDTLPADDASRAGLEQRILGLADEVQRATADALKTAKDPVPLRQRIARSTLIAAATAEAQHESRRVIALLDNFEKTIEGLPDADALLGEAMFTRVQANADLGNMDQAVAELEGLLSKSEGTRGAQVVFNLLTRLERDFASAEAQHDRPRMAAIQANRALLTRRLADWAQGHLNDPALVYRYRVYDAETQRIAATLTDDATARDAKRAEAKRLFEALDSAEGRALYAKARPADVPVQTDYDPRVALGLARLKFDAGDFAGARDAFARLLADNAVGSATAIVRDPNTGAERAIDNDVYWECSLRLFQSRLKTGGDAEPVRTWLREQYARKGDAVGGERWREAFNALAAELNVPPPATTAPASSAPADIAR